MTSPGENLLYVLKWFLARVLRPFNGQKSLFNDAGKTGYKGIKLDPYVPPRTKTNSRRPEGPNRRAKTVKFLEENMREKLHSIGFGNDLLDMTPKAQATKKKQTLWTFSSQLKTFVHQRTPPRECKGHTQNTQHRKREEISAHVSDKRLTSKHAENAQLDNWSKQIQKQTTQRDIPPKQGDMWSIGTCWAAQHHWSLGKCKPNSRNINSWPLGWLLSEKLGTKDWTQGYIQIFAHPRPQQHRSREKTQALEATRTSTMAERMNKTWSTQTKEDYSA